MPPAYCHSPPAALQREDYGATQPDWYLLLFHNCSGCSLSGGGTVDGRARLWVLPQQEQHGQLLEGVGRQLQHVEEHLPSQGPVLLPRKAVSNWADPSCPKPEECRCACTAFLQCLPGHDLPGSACRCRLWPLNHRLPWMPAAGRGWWECWTPFMSASAASP